MGVVLSNIIAIYRRELQSYFVSPLAYAIAGIFWFLSGFIFVSILQLIITDVAAKDLENQQYGIPAFIRDVPYEFLQSFLQWMVLLLLCVLPFLSMALYSEERKRGTLELLATSPITNWAVALGKLLAVLTWFTTMILPFLVFEAIAIGGTTPPMSPTIIVLGHIALILLAAAILSLGMFISSLTNSTILAAILTFTVNILLLFFDFITRNIGGAVGEALGHLSLVKQCNNLMQGIFDTSSLILFASYIILGIFLTAQSIDALRFQRQ
ncbi:ABC transporter permease subunit [Nostoc sp. KVJ3]|uniref:ABC transporter permease n=1 Tax=Nostoc sp. KVJ3 TaxID=457945 RepID=UPI0022372651|nr:ABC transporter permease [Nostoc sp. KVJ3]MCW5316027.1 ABC transporter permease subunit [Nostoc sp. KVJ3]